MINNDLQANLKEYLNNVELTIIYTNDSINKLAKTAIYLLKLVSKNKNQNNEELFQIKECFNLLTTFYVVKNNQLSLNYDLQSELNNKKLKYFKNTYVLFETSRFNKYQVIGFDLNRVLNLNLLHEQLEQFHLQFQNLRCVQFNFWNNYFSFLRKNKLINNVKNAQIFCEVLLKKVVYKFLGQEFIKANKLNIWHS